MGTGGAGRLENSGDGEGDPLRGTGEEDDCELRDRRDSVLRKLSVAWNGLSVVGVLFES